MRIAARTLLRRPGLAILVVAILALGIGTNTAVFPLVDAAWLRPLPLAAPERIVEIRLEDTHGVKRTITPEVMALLESPAGPLESVALWQWQQAVLSGVAEPRRLLGARVSERLFEVFTAQPASGRLLQPSDFVSSEEPVVIAHSLWMSQFQGAPEAIGARIILDGQSAVVVGVMPPAFRFPVPFFEYWRPLRTADRIDPKGEFTVAISGRLKPGIDKLRAHADLTALQKDQVRVTPFLDSFNTGYARPVLILTAAVLALLLIACANASNLLLARYTERQQEFQVRLALGASWQALARQVLSESFLLAGAAGVAGLVVYWVLHRAVVTRYWSSLDLLETEPPGFNPTVAIAALALVMLTTLLCTAPLAWALLRADTFRRRSSQRLRAVLLAGETALSLVLLAGAVLMMQSLMRLMAVRLGFEPHSVLTAQVAVPSTYEESAERAAYYSSLLDEVRSLPGVKRASVTTILPLGGLNATTTFRARGREDPERGKRGIYMRSVTPDYFAALGIRIHQGRVFTESDGSKSAPVAIVNEAMARRIWPGENVLGQAVSRDEKGRTPRVTIVGVVADIRHSGLLDEPKPEIYFPMAQDASFAQAATLVLQHEGPSAALVAPLRAAIRRFNPMQPVDNVKTMEAWVEAATADRRLHTSLLALFAALALLLTVAGIVAAVGYFVRMRARELAIRGALGAERRHLIAHVLRKTLVPVVIGAVTGLAASVAMGELLRGELFEVAPNDPWLLSAAAAALMAAAVLAALAAAWRVERIDPANTLRSE